MELTSRKLDTRSYPAARLIIVARSANCRIAPQVTEIGAEVTTDSLSCTQVRFIQVCAALAVQCRIQDAVSCQTNEIPPASTGLQLCGLVGPPSMSSAPRAELIEGGPTRPQTRKHDSQWV